MNDLSKNECPFCTIATGRVIASNALAFVVEDAYPISPGHLLIVPWRHVESFFDVLDVEIASMVALIHRAKMSLDERYHPSGFNIGINIGRDAGQTVMHAHVHLVPRFNGDVAQPEGGIRNVIPGKGRYV